MYYKYIESESFRATAKRGNFEGRISPDVKMNYLASPPLVIAYALAGTMDFDFETQRSAPTRTATTCT